MSNDKDVESSVRVLYMEDDEGLARLVQKRLQRQGYIVELVPDGTLGLELLAKEAFDVVLIDYSMPHRNGLDVLQAMKDRGDTTPAIMLSAQESLDVAVEAMKIGATDYLLKQADTVYLDLLPNILTRLIEKQQMLLAIKESQELLNQKTQILQTTLANISQGLCVFDQNLKLITWNGNFIEMGRYPTAFAQFDTHLQTFFDHDNTYKQASPLEKWVGENTKNKQLDRHSFDSHYGGEWQLSDGQILGINANTLPTGGFVATYTDITESKRREHRIEHQATHDKLTGLPNRQLLADRLNQSISLASRNQTKIVVTLLDLDNFKQVNDTFGHAAGDRLLKVVSDRLQEAVRDSDTVARLGGDEFVLILNNQHQEEITVQSVRRIISSVAQAVFIEGKEFLTTCSLGMSTYPIDGSDPETLLKMADIAMYRAKEDGRNTFQFYTKELQQQLVSKLEKEEKLRHAIQTNEFTLQYQPKIDLKTGKIVNAETLLRWDQIELGSIQPSEFIPFAEDIGLIVSIDEWVLNQVCLQIKSWQADGLSVQPIAVNISAETFLMKDLDCFIGNILSEHGVTAEQIVLEITETASMRDIEQSIKTMRKLRERGFSLSIDDFGSGYSNLNHLRHFPVNSIKVDHCFVSGLPDNPLDLAMIKAIIAMGHSLGMKIIAEGVETEAQMSLLAANGCDEMQGFYFSKPVPAHVFAQMLHEDKFVDAEKLGRGAHDRGLLIVDDDPNVLSSLKRSLRKAGYQLFFANNAFEALDLIAKNEIVVVLTDHNMPMMTGVDLLGRIKLLYPHTTRILMSGLDDVQMAINAINRGSVFKFIAKPFEIVELTEVLEEAFDHHEKMAS